MDLGCRGYLIYSLRILFASIGFSYNTLQTETNLTYI